MGDIDERMVTISDNMVMMNRNIGSMTRDSNSMNANIRSMANDTTTMAGSTLNMQRDMWSLNRNVSGPLGMMNMFNPWVATKGRSRGTGSVLPAAHGWRPLTRQNHSPHNREPSCSIAPVTE
jgi:hypothetical protein